MEMETQKQGRVLVVRPLEKRLDSGNAPAFKSTMVDYVFQDNLYIALDLSNIEFMDSSGLSALLATLKTVRGRGGLVLFNVGANVAKLLSITRLDKEVFEIHPDEQSAVQSLNS